MGDLSKNLSRHEFACTCGCGFDTVDAKTVEVIQDVCDNFSCRVNISSGCRCFEYNRLPASEGGPGSSDGSQHPRGRAGDCHFLGVAPDVVWVYVNEKYPELYGFGLYSWGVHIDTRTNGPARWDGR